jgi:nucleoside 2-deoxyribosyltransferase
MLKMNAFLNSVVRSGKPIYCAAPLFSPLDRMAGANVAGILETIIRKNAKDSNIDISNCIFLPFRDTSQSTFAGPDRAQRIFQLDIDTLRTSSALLARFDGLAKDSGVAMEIGFAFGASLPIGILVTSFMGEGFGANESEWQVDPVIAQMADICFCMPIFPRVATSYYQSQHIHEWEGVRQFVETALEKFSARAEPRPLSRIEGSISTVYVDIMGGRYEWTRDVQRRIRASCTPLGFEVKPSRRYSNPVRDPAAGAYQDIQSALSGASGEA